MKDTLRKNEVLGYFNLDQILNKRRKKTIKRIRYTTYIYTSPCISLAYILHISTCSIRMNIEWIFHISGTQFFFPSILQNFHPPSPSLSHSFHHAMKKKKEEGKLLKREEKSWKRKGGKRERKSNKPSLLSSPTTLSPSTIPSTPNLPPSSGYSSFLSFLFLLDHPPLLIYMHMHNHRHRHNFQLCIRGREHNESARHGSIVRARTLPPAPTISKQRRYKIVIVQAHQPCQTIYYKIPLIWGFQSYSVCLVSLFLSRVTGIHRGWKIIFVM